MKLPAKIPLRLLGAALLLVILIAPQARGTQAASRITSLEIREQHSEAELRVDGAIEYGYFPLSEPHRLVFNFPGTILDINDGETISSEIEGAAFREILLSQFSTEPPIARMVFYTTGPATATVSFDPSEGNLIIRIELEDGDELSPEPEILGLFSGTTESAQVEETPRLAAIPTEPVYDVQFGTGDVLITFPGLTADDVRVNQLRFPDRLNIRMFTLNDIGNERPRFDALDRGNIWNEVAKTWTSYIDRDGRGVIDLTVYIYPTVSYNQSISTSGIPEIRIFGIEPTIEISEIEIDIEPEPIAEVEVAAYGTDIEEEELIEEAVYETPEPMPVVPEIVEENLIEEEALIEESPLTEEIPVYPEEFEPSMHGPINLLCASDTMEVIEDAVLITDTADIDPTALIIERHDPEPTTELPTMVAQATMIQPAGLPALPLAVGQSNLLHGDGLGADGPIYMRTGEVIVLRVNDLIRASVGNPSVATLNVISQDELLVTALAAGTTTLLAWENGNGYTAREISVLDATSAHEEEIAAVIDNDGIDIRIIMSGDTESAPGVLLEGNVETEEEKIRAHMIAALYAGERVTNLIEVTNPRQVLAQVRFVEIDKRALDEHLSHFSAAARTDDDAFTIGIITDLLDPANPGGGLFDSRTRPGIVNGETEDIIYDPIDAVLNELESNRNASILSSPNVIAMSGHSAHFRVGGEIPYTYLNESGVTVVEFKEFGISLDMTPMVDSQENIMMTIAPTVRTVDYALAIAGIPGFRTREMVTEVQLRPGETLMIGGLLQSEITEIISEVPLLSDIPILGELFRSKRFSEDETELVIFITPYLIEKPEDSAEYIGIDPQLSE